MRKYLLLINIGPVQGFIATARRTRDLYAGSRLLSDAAYILAHKLENQGAELIFPAPNENIPLSELKEAGIVNVVLAMVEQESAEALKDFMDGLEEETRNYLRQEAEPRLQKALESGVIPTQEALEAGLAQVEDLLEFFWAAVPFDPASDRYQTKREELYALMAARKNLRNFSPTTPWAQSVFKSSLDGALESVTSLYWNAGAQSVRDEQAKHEDRKQKLGLHKGEELSGVDLLKRLYLSAKENVPKGFASTTHVAALPFLVGLGEGKRQKLADRLLALAKKYEIQGSKGWTAAFVPDAFKRIDPGLLYPSRYAEFGLSGSSLEEAHREIERIYAELNAHPGTYYALLHADGDRMGKTIYVLSEQGYLRHQELSREEARFAAGVGQQIEGKDCLGSLVYSGGDDVLALLPLHTVLECARRLSEEFRKRMQKFKISDGSYPTLSVGIAVVHHLFDLGEALNLARRAEKAAKEKRNSLAVIWSPRSGTETLVKGSWDEPCAKPCALDQRLATFAQWSNGERIPSGFAYELREMVKSMQTSDPHTDSDIDREKIKEIVNLEAERILKRKGIEDPGVLSALMIYLEKLGAETLANELIASRPFAEAFKLAKSNVRVCQPDNGKEGER